MAYIKNSTKSPLKEIKSLLNLMGVGSGFSYAYSATDIYMPSPHPVPDPNLVKSIENDIT